MREELAPLMVVIITWDVARAAGGVLLDGNFFDGDRPKVKARAPHALITT